ncbi:hypothetical protein EW146_g4655 [Bondarzewia mesenterica]|uniref:FAD-binding domain-containing protein n=1 Tax=Bondarzewia mesenterica TaxID=1095465 RepID=A0A4S4LW25_9AGAM|nr:hypothetical protein EW146_g4655 [Bondarzewia mesenterica]
MVPTQRQAVYQLDIAIVGAGLAGLASAYALAVSGHRVRIFERSAGLPKAAGGLRVPPNATKILDYWGLHEELLRQSSKVKSNTFPDMATGEIIGHTEWAQEMFKDSGGEFRCMRHEDLIQMLYNHATTAGARFTFNALVTGVSPAPAPLSPPPLTAQPPLSPLSPNPALVKPSITLSTHEVIQVDLIIGADGPRSLVRSVVDEDAGEVEETPTGLSVYTGVVDMDVVMNDEHLRDLARVHFPVWMGDGRMAVGEDSPDTRFKPFPIGRDEGFAVHIYWPEELPEDSPDYELVPPTAIKYDRLDPRLVSFLKKTKSLTRMRWIERSPAEDWVDSSESIILIARILTSRRVPSAFKPCAMHASSDCLEAAFVLSTLLSHLRTRSQLPSLLYAYHDLRSPRSARLHQVEMDNHMYLGLRAGEGKEERDAAMRTARLATERGSGGSSDGEDDGELERQWGEICEIWGYDAREDAEDWWVKWGLLRERASSMNDGALGLDDSYGGAGQVNRFEPLEVRVNAS